MGGSQGYLQPEALPWLPAGASVVGRPGGDGQPASHPPQCRLCALHSEARALAVTPPGRLRGRGQCRSE